MEETRQPQPYPQPVPASPVSQRAQWLQQPLLSPPHPNNEPPSAEQPWLICGFTLTELANVAIQVAGVTIAAVFGAWAVKAYESANVANQLSEDSLSQSNIANQLAQNALEQSLYANKLAIINLCLSDQYRNSADCPSILSRIPFCEHRPRCHTDPVAYINHHENRISHTDGTSFAYSVGLNDDHYNNISAGQCCDAKYSSPNGDGDDDLVGTNKQ